VYVCIIFSVEPQYVGSWLVFIGSTPAELSTTYLFCFYKHDQTHADIVCGLNIDSVVDFPVYNYWLCGLTDLSGNLVSGSGLLTHLWRACDPPVAGSWPAGLCPSFVWWRVVKTGHQINCFCLLAVPVWDISSLQFVLQRFGTVCRRTASTSPVWIDLSLVSIPIFWSDTAAFTFSSVMSVLWQINSHDPLLFCHLDKQFT